MNYFQIISTLLFLFDFSQAQVGCQGKTGLFAADPNGPSQSYLQCASGQLFVYKNFIGSTENPPNSLSSIIH